MTKTEFLVSLRQQLYFLPQDDIEERLSFYGEMIDDRVEEGLSEAEAVAAVGTVDEIVSGIISEIPISKIAKERIRPKRQLRVWEIVLLVLGSPIWFSLLVAAFAVAISLYAALWAVIISLWAVFVAFAACSIGCIFAGVFFAVGGNVCSGLATIAAGLVCSGLAIFSFYGCGAVSKGITILTKKFAIGIKNCFIKKEAAK